MNADATRSFFETIEKSPARGRANEEERRPRAAAREEYYSCGTQKLVATGSERLSLQSIESDQSMESAHNIESDQSMESDHNIESDQSIESDHSIESYQSIEPDHNIESDHSILWFSIASR